MLTEKTAAGFTGTVAAMLQKHPEIDNPWALTRWMAKKKYKSHYKDQPNKDSQDPKKPEKKEKYKDEDKKGFKEWLEGDLPEILEEGWGKNLVTAGLLGLGAVGMSGCGNSSNHQRVTAPNAAEFLDTGSQMQQKSAWEENGYAYGQATVRIIKALGKGVGKTKAQEQAGMEARNNLCKYIYGSQKVAGGYQTKGTLKGVETVSGQDNGDGTYTITVRCPK